MFNSVIFPLWPLKPFDSTWDRAARGLWGERAVARMLWRRGHRILAHRWQGPGKTDIDLIAATADRMIFCEVKVRTINADDAWLKVIEEARLELLRRAAGQYLRQHRQTRVNIQFNAYLVEPRLHSPRAPRITANEAYLNPATVPGWKGIAPSN